MVCRVIRAREADIRRVWLDSEITLPEACAQVGMSKDALQARAAALGLPHRRTGRREVIRPDQEQEFRLMWQCGIAAREIGEAFRCSYFAVINTAARLNLTMRGAGYVPKLTLAQYRERRLAVAMRHDAIAELPIWKGAMR